MHTLELCRKTSFDKGAHPGNQHHCHNREHFRHPARSLESPTCQFPPAIAPADPPPHFSVPRKPRASAARSKPPRTWNRRVRGGSRLAPSTPHGVLRFVLVVVRVRSWILIYLTTRHPSFVPSRFEGRWYRFQFGDITKTRVVHICIPT